MSQKSQEVQEVHEEVQEVQEVQRSRTSSGLLRSILSPIGVDTATGIANKSMIIPFADTNDDGVLNLYEAIALFHQLFGLSKEQALQIDCSECADSHL